MASAPCCAAGAPLVHEYTPTGVTTFGAEKLPIYTVGAKGSTSGIVVLTDIFGWPTGPGFTGEGYKQCMQVCDRLAAESNSTVVLIDPFRGDYWPMSKMPPSAEDNIYGWMMGYSFEKVHPDVDQAVECLKAAGALKMGILGICWGSAIAAYESRDPRFSASAAIHPSFLNQDASLAAEMQCPMILLPADNDPLESMKVVLDTKPFGSECVYHRFVGQEHGFCAARGDWSKPEIAAAASKAVTMMSDFFKKHLA